MEQVHIDDRLFDAFQEMVTQSGLISFLEYNAQFPPTEEDYQWDSFQKLMGYVRGRGLPFANYLDAFFEVLTTAHRVADEQGVSFEMGFFDPCDSERGELLRPIYEAFRMDEKVRKGIDYFLARDMRDHVSGCPECLERYGALLERVQDFYSTLETDVTDSHLLGLFSSVES